MTETPVVGRWYLVPTVAAVWNREFAHWPVIGPEHTDEQFFNFRWTHYHIDGRFLTARQRQQAVYCWSRDIDFERLARACMGSPLQSNDSGTNPNGLPRPQLRRKRCAIAVILPGEEVTKAATYLAMVKHFAGTTCARGKRGFVCPHQNAALGSVPIIDGVITCPLHGLRIDAATGVVLSSSVKLSRAN